MQLNGTFNEPLFCQSINIFQVKKEVHSDSFKRDQMKCSSMSISLIGLMNAHLRHAYYELMWANVMANVLIYDF